MLNGLCAQRGNNYVKMAAIKERFQQPNFDSMTGEDIVYEFAEAAYMGNLISAADKILADFRKGFLGTSSLEAPPLIPLAGTELGKEKGTKIKRNFEKEALEEIQTLDVGQGQYDGW